MQKNNFDFNVDLTKYFNSYELKEIFDNYKFNQNTFEFNKWFSKIFNISIEEKEKHKWQSMGQLKNIKKYLCIWENLNGNEIKQRKIELEFSNREKFSIMLKDKQLVKNFRCRLPF